MTAVDISKVAMHWMQIWSPDSDVAWVVADVTCLPFAPAAFDAVVDKSMSDTLFFRNQSQHRCALVTAFWREVDRVLSGQGTYINISSRKSVPWQRDFFSEDAWDEIPSEMAVSPEAETCKDSKKEQARWGRERSSTCWIHSFLKIV